VVFVQPFTTKTVSLYFSLHFATQFWLSLQIGFAYS